MGKGGPMNTVSVPPSFTLADLLMRREIDRAELIAALPDAIRGAMAWGGWD
jgi:hypothetical protein